MIVHKLIPRLLVLFLTVQLANAQQKSPLTRQYITPVRIVWKNGDVRNSEQLLKPGIGQGDLANRNIVILNNKKAGEKASILLDFGRELHACRLS